MQTRNGSTIAWSSADLPTTINHGSLSAQFSYTPTRKRWRQSSSYSTGTETTIYVGSDLEKLTTSVRTHWKHRIHTPSGFVVVNRRSDGTNQTLYVPSDHLSSSDAVTDASGAVLVRPNFASYGARRDSDWDGAPPAADLQAIADTTRRGYTDHEMLDNVALVNMNGRVYEPTIGRFLSADPVLFPFGTTRAANPYSYVENEPLSYRDPSGFTPIPAEEIIVTASRRGEWRSTWTPDECDIWGYSAAGCSWEAYRNRSSRETMEWFEYPDVGEYIAEDIESTATRLPEYSPPMPLFDWHAFSSFSFALANVQVEAGPEDLQLPPCSDVLEGQISLGADAAFFGYGANWSGGPGVNAAGQVFWRGTAGDPTSGWGAKLTAGLGGSVSYTTVVPPGMVESWLPTGTTWEIQGSFIVGGGFVVSTSTDGSGVSFGFRPSVGFAAYIGEGTTTDSTMATPPVGCRP
jgi:RHS repeat-associated protein